MKKFFSQTTEIKALVIAITATVLGFLGTMFLFWFQRYDIPLAVLTSGLIISLSWLCLYLSRKGDKKRVKLDIVLIYSRLILIVLLATLFTALELSLSLVIISPITLVISYLVISLLTLLAYIQKKGENDV